MSRAMERSGELEKWRIDYLLVLELGVNAISWAKN